MHLEKQAYGRFAVTVALLGATLAASTISENRKPEVLAKPLESIEREIAGWSATRDEALGETIVESLTPTSYLLRSYRRQNRELGLFVAFYAQQRAGESMHSPKYCLPGAGWEIVESGRVFVPVGARQEEVNKFVVQKNRERTVVLYWYQSRRRIVASEYAGKMFLVRDALFDGSTAGSIVRLTAPDRPGSLEEEVAFASRLIPQIERCLR
jgi:EpsI family protein